MAPRKDVLKVTVGLSLMRLSHEALMRVLILGNPSARTELTRRMKLGDDPIPLEAFNP